VKIVNSPTAGWRVLRKLSVAAACVGLLTVSAPAVANASLAPALSKPTVISFKAAPSKLSAAGGLVTLTAKVSGATTCTFGGHGTETVSCTGGTAKIKDKLGPNKTTKKRTIVLSLVVKGKGGTAPKATVKVTEAAKVLTSTTTPPTTAAPTTTTTPGSATGLSYDLWRPMHVHVLGWTGLQRLRLGRAERRHSRRTVPQLAKWWLCRHSGPADRPGEHHDVRRRRRGYRGIESHHELHLDGCKRCHGNARPG
jgi:hypothetical protein